MMELFNYFFLSAIFLIPGMSLAYLFIQTPQARVGKISPHGIFVFFLISAIAITRLATLTEFDTASYILAGFFSASELEFAFSISAERLWVFIGMSFSLLLQFLFFPLFFHQRGKEIASFGYLLGAYWSACLGIFTEKILISIMFTEFALFFLCALSLLNADDDDIIKQNSYFKRNLFLFPGLLLMFVFCFIGGVQSGTVIFWGFIIYLISVICNRKQFPGAPNFFFWQIAMFCAVYLNWRLFQTEMQFDYLSEYSFFYISLAIIFALISFSMTAQVNAFYWYVLSIICGYFSLKMIYPDPRAMVLLVGDVVLLLMQGVFLLLALSRTAWAEKKSVTTVRLLNIFLLVAHVLSVAVPYSIIGGIFDAEENQDISILVAYFAFLFFVTAAVARLLWGNIAACSDQGEGRERKMYALEYIPAFLFILICILNFISARKLFPESAITAEFSEKHVAFALSFFFSVLSGALFGVFLPRTAFFSNYLKKIASISKFGIFSKTKLAIENGVRIFTRFSSEGWKRVVLLLEFLITTITDFFITINNNFLKWIVKELQALLNSLSYFVRYMHCGYVKFYLVFSVITFVVIALIFVV